VPEPSTNEWEPISKKGKWPISKKAILTFMHESSLLLVEEGLVGNDECGVTIVTQKAFVLLIFLFFCLSYCFRKGLHQQIAL
jgi:hypothetical protein